MINFDFEKNCYGCRNCENICPTKAIKMKENNEGFLIPVIEKEKCINCGLCNKKCPFLNIKEDNTNVQLRMWYSCYMKDEKKRQESSSGGIFPLLADWILQSDGYVCGCIWNNEIEAVHVVSNKKEDIDRMKGSKYVQSNLENIVEELKALLKDERKVLFTGTPCQVAAIKNYFLDEPNLYTMAVICEGVASPKVWREYKNYIEKKNNSKIENVKFRCKDIGWEPPIMKIFFENGKVKSQLTFSANIFGQGFLQGLFYRNSCNNCQYKLENYNADIIVGDLWGASNELLKLTNNKGISAVFVNTLKGKELFGKIKENMVFELIDFQRVIKENKMIIESRKKHKNREKFFDNINDVDIKTNIKKNLKLKKHKQFKNSIKEIAYKTKTYNFIRNIVK